MRPLKVAWDNNIACRDKAGTGVYASRLLQEFTVSREITVTALDGWQHRFRSAGLFGRAIGTVSDLLWTHAWLPVILLNRTVDLLHIPAFVGPLVAPCPTVVTVHDVTYLLYPSHFSRWWSTYLGAIMPRVLRSAAAIITVSEHSKQDIVKFYGVPDEKVRVVPNGVDHARFHPGAVLAPAWAQSVGLNDNYVLHVGTLAHRKNIPTLIRAIAHLRDQGEWGARRLVLAGSENRAIQGADEVFRCIAELDLKSSVVLAGHVSDENLPGLYRNASLLVMPSLYEGFGFPVLEAMASGTPVICSNTSSLPEVGGDAVIYIEPQDHLGLAAAISEVLSRPSLSQEMQQKGLKRASQFGWQRAARETIGVYREVVHM